MSVFGRRWMVYDRDGSPIYLSDERWQHIIHPLNHPEIIEYEARLQIAIQKARRQQEPLNPRKYRYMYPFDDLPAGFNHVVVIVLFGFDQTAQGRMISNNSSIATSRLPSA